MSSPASVKTTRVHGNRRPRWALCGLALVVGLPLLTGCKTDRDPRTGGFFDGVENLTSGGYDDFVREKRYELSATHEESAILLARAQMIQGERDALDRELESVARELRSLQDRLAIRRAALDATQNATAAERRRLEEAENKARLAQLRFDKFQQEPAPSIATARQEVDDLKHLIGTIGTMVNELSS